MNWFIKISQQNNTIESILDGYSVATDMMAERGHHNYQHPEIQQFINIDNLVNQISTPEIKRRLINGEASIVIEILNRFRGVLNLFSNAMIRDSISFTISEPHGDGVHVLGSSSIPISSDADEEQISQVVDFVIRQSLNLLFNNLFLSRIGTRNLPDPIFILYNLADKFNAIMSLTTYRRHEDTMSFMEHPYLRSIYEQYLQSPHNIPLQIGSDARHPYPLLITQFIKLPYNVLLHVIKWLEDFINSRGQNQ